MAFEWLSGEKTKDQNRSLAHAEGAKGEWNRLRDEYYGPEGAGIQPGEMLISDNPLDTDPNKLHRYETGPMQAAETARRLDPALAAELGINTESAATMDGGSHWGAAESAFDGMGPSSWDSYSSEYGNLGPSSFGDLAYDQRALAGMDASGDYFSDLSSTGSDPIAEADFQRRTAAAEASRRSNTDAALAQLEQRGQGNANAGLLAELSNQQASVGDQYLAGLDANAMAAGRRDNAAMTGAQIAQMRGQGMLSADTARAGGMDAYEMERAGGMDTAGARQAAGQDSYAMGQAAGQDSFTGAAAAGQDQFAQNKMQMVDDWERSATEDYYGNAEFNAGQRQHASDRNMDRQWGSQDANTDMWNNAATYNQTQRPQQLFDQRAAIATGGANTRLGAASQYGSIAQQQDDKTSGMLDRAFGKPKEGGGGAVGSGVKAF